MKLILTIKQYSGLIFLITFFLPLSWCGKKVVKVELTSPSTHYEIRSTDKGTTDDKHEGIKAYDTTNLSVPNNEKSGTGYNVPCKMFEPKELNFWLLLISFSWPFLLSVYFYIGKHKKIITGLKIIEPIACIWSILISFSLSVSFFGSTLISGYISMCSIITYFTASCTEKCIMISRVFKGEKHKNDNRISNKNA